MWQMQNNENRFCIIRCVLTHACACWFVCMSTSVFILFVCACVCVLLSVSVRDYIGQLLFCPTHQDFTPWGGSWVPAVRRQWQGTLPCAWATAWGCGGQPAASWEPTLSCSCSALLRATPREVLCSKILPSLWGSCVKQSPGNCYVN